MLICAWLKSWYLVPSIHPWAGCYSREKETIWAAFLPFIVWNPWRLRERQRAQSDGEVERWGTKGPVRTRRHCVAPQLCWTDSLHYSTLQQPAPQSTANLLLTAPLASSGKGGGNQRREETDSTRFPLSQINFYHPNLDCVCCSFSTI